jgi:quinol monooxygenase YgiN
MILTRIIFTAFPEKRKELMQTLLSMLETKGKEKGCMSYGIFNDIHKNTVFNLIEEWKTREDLNRYIGSEKFSVLLGTKSLLAKPLEIKIHSIFHTEGNDAVYILRS